METYTVPRRRAVMVPKSIGIASLFALCGWASYHVALDVLHWRDNPSEARRISADTRSTDAQLRDATLVLRRDVSKSIEALLSIRGRGGEAGEQAALALARIVTDAGR